ncbi:hypothetical protein UFOVP787_75 [uncultured Caudovirales phage]|uniref:Uncharacterized protein n=1 Tax=uncultured Caudovirales phage TaxID=2100421 RepID=A0A6J5NUH6_9CAUD|nr:hypothetical protein UFOVP787_75 [uncultured Caudovirales phage]
MKLKEVKPTNKEKTFYLCIDLYTGKYYSLYERLDKIKRMPHTVAAPIFDSMNEETHNEARI